MADIMRVKRSTMTSLGDITRSITGTTGALTTAQMQSELTTAKTNIDETKELICEMTGATGELSLEQMKAQIEDANAEVEEQAALIAEISDILTTKAAGGGGSGEVVDTCTITFNGYYLPSVISYKSYDEQNGFHIEYLTAQSDITSYPIVAENVVCGSMMFMYRTDDAVAIDGGVVQHGAYMGADIYSAPTESGASGTITGYLF